MHRRTALPIVVIAAAALCLAVAYLAKHSLQTSSRTVIAGSAPAAASPRNTGRTRVGPYLDELTGVLTLQPGDSVDSNGVGFSVEDVQAPFPSSSAGPAPVGSNEYMVVKLQVRNALATGGESLTISSTANFELDDASGHVYPPAELPGAPNPPEGKIAPGQALEGGLSYDIPAGRSYRFLFKDSRVSNGEIAVDLGRR